MSRAWVRPSIFTWIIAVPSYVGANYPLDLLQLKINPPGTD
jgi:hypothetical protein